MEQQVLYGIDKNYLTLFVIFSIKGEFRVFLIFSVKLEISRRRESGNDPLWFISAKNLWNISYIFNICGGLWNQRRELKIINNGSKEEKNFVSLTEIKSNMFSNLYPLRCWRVPSLDCRNNHLSLFYWVENRLYED